MPSLDDNLISRQTFDAQELVASYPPQFHHTNKQILYDYASPAGCRHEGRLSFTRWTAFDLPADFRPSEFHTVLEVRDGFFGYEPTPTGKAIAEWYLNFAHYDLFCAYGRGLFAQDEIQVAEHPALASLREGCRILRVDRAMHAVYDRSLGEMEALWRANKDLDLKGSLLEAV